MISLNSISRAIGAKSAKKRVGRGIGSGLGKTCGKGHKGQKARAGGYHKINFEGGQMPLQKRLPKLGFQSRRKKYVDQVTLSELCQLDNPVIDLEVLKRANLIKRQVKVVRIIDSGELNKMITIKGLKATKGAREAITSFGGTVE